MSDFNPRSREGSDKCSRCKNEVEINFNPRSREGSDGIDVSSNNGSIISIHAPAKGATPYTAVPQTSLEDFNPRSREGSDRSVSSSVRIESLFQSTLPRRERLQPPGYGAMLLFYFNPRSREGSDGSGRKKCRWITYFNPRSREGSDLP